MPELGAESVRKFAGYRDLELLRRGRRHLLLRARRVSDDRPVVLKAAAADPASEAELGVLVQEHELLRQLGFPGVVQALALEARDGQLFLVLEDAGRESLADILHAGPLDLDRFLALAPELAETLARVHQAGIVHRDVTPFNVVLDPGSGAVTLIDFGMASALPSAGGAEPAAARPEGNLAYLSPEQAGRMGRPVDARSDLYSLGAILYQMLVGAPPFTARDPVELLHAHVALAPVPPHEANPEVPMALSGIVLRLLAKDPEERYQTAEALTRDLREARRRWSQGGAIEPFALGRRDQPSLRLPERLYGREEASARLQEALEETCRGRGRLVMITGPAGIGKSALIGQALQGLQARRVRLAAGKFDLLRRGEPYAALADALRHLVRTLLGEGGEAFEHWKARLQEDLGPNSGVLLDLLPDLGRVLGPQPAAPELDPFETRHRFQGTVAALLGVFATPSRPLVLFLDDLQWADPASLDVLEHLALEEGLPHLLLLGAFRDDEVGPDHPLAVLLQHLAGAGRPCELLALEPLSLEHLAQFCQDALACPPDSAVALAGFLLERGGGNPFFSRHLLLSMHRLGLLRFDGERRRWDWDPGRARRADLAGNADTLLASSLSALPPETRGILTLASCSGNQFQLGLVAAAAGETDTSAVRSLWPAVVQGLVDPLDAPEREPVGEQAPAREPSGRFEFVHDRVQQAAYSLASEAERRRAHLALGTLVRSRCGTSEEVEDNLFEIVDHLNQACSLLDREDSRTELAELDLRAGLRARSTAAWRAAASYFEAGLECLPPEAWRSNRDLWFSLHRERAECAFLCGDFDLAGRLVQEALEQDLSTWEKADLYRLLAVRSTTAGDFGQALEWIRQGLRLFGMDLPDSPARQAFLEELESARSRLRELSIPSLADCPEMTGQAARICTRLLADTVGAAYFHDPVLSAWAVARVVNLSLDHGPSLHSPFCYAFFACSLGAVTGDYATADQLARAGLELARRQGNPAWLCRTMHIAAHHVFDWTIPLRDTIPLDRQAHRLGVQSGELLYASYAASGVVNTLFALGAPLDEVQSETQSALGFAAHARNRAMVDILTGYRQALRSLQGLTGRKNAWDEEGFEEAAYAAGLEGDATALCLYHFLRLHNDFLFGDLEAARGHAREARRYLDSAWGLPVVAERATFALLAGEGGDEDLAALAHWAEVCPANFSHRLALVRAEQGRGESLEESLRLYDEAIRSAHENGSIRDEALANLLAGRALAQRGWPRLAGAYLASARRGFARWGARALVLHLEETWGELLPKAPGGVGEFPTDWPRQDSSSQEVLSSLDLLSMHKASQALSSEVQLEALLEKLMRVVLEAAGAQRGVLVLEDEGPPKVRVHGPAGEDGRLVLGEFPLHSFPGAPSSLVQLVRRTREEVILEDASRGEPSAGDRYFRDQEIRSVLCLPLGRGPRPLGVLYLENNLAPGVFTRPRVDLVHLLSTQMAISLENSLLFEGLRREIGQRQRTQEELAALNEQLEQKVQQRTAELEVSNRALSRAAEVRSRFLSSLSHELRTPLNAVLGFSELLQEEAASEDMHRMAGGIHESGQHLLALLNDVLDLSRIEAGRLELHRETMDLSSLLAGLGAALSDQFHRRGLRLVLPEGPLGEVTVDPQRFRQVLYNLLSNAMKFSPTGSSVEVEATREGGALWLRVVDHGVGIAPEDRERIFEPFEQVESDHPERGTGLGLAITRQLVEAHGGRIELESTPGQGSTFTVVLPLSPGT